MKLVFLYRPQSEHASATEQYIKDFQHLHPDVNLETLDVDSVEGIAKIQLYDIVAYPAILALASDGQLLNFWMGSLPLMDEVFSAVMNSG